VEVSNRGVRRYKNKNIAKGKLPYIKEVKGIGVFTIGVLLLFSLFFQGRMGLFGSISREILSGLTGLSSIIIPFILLVYGVYLILNKAGTSRKIYYIIGFVVLVAAILQTCLYDMRDTLGILQKINTSYKYGTEFKGGGVLGELFSIPLILLFKKLGTVIILAMLLVVDFMLISDIPLSVMLQKGAIASKKIGLKIKKIFYKSDSQAGKIDKKDSTNKPSSRKKQNAKNITLPDYEVKEVQEAEILEHTGPPIENLEISTEISYNSKDVIYKYPSIDILEKSDVKGKIINNSEQAALEGAKKLESTLKSFGVEAKIINISLGPAVTRYELQPNVGVKVSKIVALADDISLNLAATGIRIEAPIPGKAAVGIEVPNKEVVPVSLRDVIKSQEFMQHPSKLAVGWGKDISGKCIVTDIARMPHVLIAGATGSGKSVCINTLIISLLFKASPNEVKLIMIDPKVVELGIYNGIPHLLIPVVTEPRKAAGALGWAVQEMVKRYNLFAECGARDIKSYNRILKERLLSDKENEAKEPLPQIVIIIDELADLMMVAPNEVEDSICRLAQMARAAGMHLVIATQRPSVDVITGLIKANIPSRIAFAVSSQIDSRTILDMAGAEKLQGRGDMLFYPVGESKPVRVKGAFVSDKEVERVVEYVKCQASAQYSEDVMEEINGSTKLGFDAQDADEFLARAIELVVDAGQASASLIQRKFKVGYARAARIVDQMEERGIVGSADGSKPREVLIGKEKWYEMKMSSGEN